ncbi:hypothetical protein ZHAS_00016041 [Anopheles sinensis]|uniref:Uncharacterized protein n=1 Tax=Anopheles sinensis TaxID=74873 RepID=A0A084WCX6_ANOSI|nr:hypothetical protein ZHAS_00016041 [Anopheles sinensis]
MPFSCPCRVPEKCVARRRNDTNGKGATDNVPVQREDDIGKIETRRHNQMITKQNLMTWR